MLHTWIFNTLAVVRCLGGPLNLTSCPLGQHDISDTSPDSFPWTLSNPKVLRSHVAETETVTTAETKKNFPKPETENSQKDPAEHTTPNRQQRFFFS